MKKKDRYKLLNYAKMNYSEIFNRKYEFKKMSKRDLYELLRQNIRSSMCEWSYCCYGLYKNCWQDPIEEGVWGMTQGWVDKCIKRTIDETAKSCRRDNRILYCKDEHGVHVVIIARDVDSRDYLIFFTNKEYLI